MSKDSSEDSAKKVQELQELLTKRSSIKGRITKFKKFLSNIKSKDELSPLELSELKLKLSRFEILYNKFDDLQGQIEILNASSLSTEIDERDDIEQVFTSTIALAQSIIQGHQSKGESNLIHDNLNSSMKSTVRQNPDHDDISFKLPQIQIAKFDGAYFRWLEFRDSFLSIIHNNERIAPIHKFHYLISYLEGDASRIISNLEVSSVNYSTAWNLLCERYDNKRQLISHHLNSLLNIQQTRESDRSLRFLVDHITKNLRALSSLGLPTDGWDVLIIHIMCSKLDSRTLTKWEEWRGTLDDTPNLQQFNKFLIDRADVLGSLIRCPSNNFAKNSMTPTKSSNIKFEHPQTKSFVCNQASVSPMCVVCQGDHRIYDCPSFKAKGVHERITNANKLKLCLNCLRSGHSVRDCRLGSCRECKGRHNTLLHIPKNSQSSDTNSPQATNDQIVNFSQNYSKTILLSTALIQVINPATGYGETVRALLDCGSQSSFINQSLKDKLSLSSHSNNIINIIGIGNNVTNKVSDVCVAQLKSSNNSFSITTSFLVLPELTGNLPKFNIDISQLQIPNNIQLADPKFHQSAAIEVLIGADLFWDILGCEQRSLGPNKPVLRSSQLGWLISGAINTSPNKSINVQCNHALIQDEIHHQLTKFWELEEVPLKCPMSEEEKACEKHFLSNTVRLASGRFSVSLPLKDTPDCLGDSYSVAKKRFLNLERRFRKHPNIKLQYIQFMKEYSDLGHLSISLDPKPHTSYFLSHHAVFKANSESTKLRVVFDGSAPTTSGLSINDLLMIGPNKQDSLFSILVRARQYKFLLTGDLEKMYRQIQVNEQDRDLQLILWREDESLPIKTCKLNTVTYGMASSSYLSTRCLWQLGEECSDPTIKTIIQNDFYVDDLITGCDEEALLSHILHGVSNTLKQGCFNLRKLKTNLPSIFSSSTIDLDSELTLSESSSTLGLGWVPGTDTLHFPIQLQEFDQSNEPTKRSILSNLFKIFDPLGLLSPCVVSTKILLQKLWVEKLTWDEPVSKNIAKDWNDFNKKLPILLSITVPRQVLCDNPISIQLHSFCDASQSAFGACVYLRSVNSANHVTVHLLCSKSKVAPIKPTTIPRLELCAAVLAARLCQSVRQSLRYEVTSEVHWSDSSVVLSWLQSSTSNLKCFVANRISEICDLTNQHSWRHVPTSLNPADLISRGISPAQIKENTLWWSGPQFLKQSPDTWPNLNTDLNIQDLPELKATSISANVSVLKDPILHFENFSSFNKLKRCFAYILRFIHNVRDPNNRHSGSLTVDELHKSFTYLCRIAQQQSFPQEYDLLTRKQSLNSKSKILCLSPFIGDDTLIRVGGRIQASDVGYDKKHPILLHASHNFTKLIFDYEHKRNLHAGPQLLLCVVREYVWPINGRHLARRTVHNCVKCRRLCKQTLQPMMGNLPSQRVTPDFPFRSVGIDFAGPFLTLNRKGRGAKLVKSYLCLFVCLRYKCLHLEAVSDLTKDAFILTFRRFVSRRGKPVEVFSDNGRNFVSAAKELSQFLKSNASSISDFATEENIKFIFSPSYAPHFGGIWEAGVKSAKHHLKRVMGNSHLTFEELSTLFAQVEAVLNSRPICPLSASPDDFSCLTPGHFLVGRALTTLPSPAFEDYNANSLQRYARLQQINQHFWRRWQQEYLAELQQRSKWRTDKRSAKVGDLVLLKDDNLPPLSWRLGRIHKLFPGPDNISRVADVNTQRGITRRPLVRLCPLPSLEDMQG